jgi:hypothetical protein
MSALTALRSAVEAAERLTALRADTIRGERLLEEALERLPPALARELRAALLPGAAPVPAVTAVEAPIVAPAVPVEPVDTPAPEALAGPTAAPAEPSPAPAETDEAVSASRYARERDVTEAAVRQAIGKGVIRGAALAPGKPQRIRAAIADRQVLQATFAKPSKLQTAVQRRKGLKPDEAAAVEAAIAEGRGTKFNGPARMEGGATFNGGFDL